jgi:glycosyltransferase involved in cell wall biosynthesis
MQILINGWFWNQPTVGYGQYLHGIVDGLRQLGTGHRIIVAQPAAQGAGPPLPDGIEGLSVGTRLDQRPKPAKILFEQWALPRAAAQLARSGSTVLFVPYFGGPLFSTVPVVTTVGDLIPLVLPAYRGSAAVRAYSALVSAAARRSREMLTFSEFSRQVIINRLQIKPQRVTAAALAAGRAFAPAADALQLRGRLQQAYGLPRDYVYYVGGLDQRKNVVTLLRAWARLPERLQHIPLVIAGRALGSDRALFPDLDAVIAEQSLTQRVRRIEVPIEDGPLLYQGATVFVYPSSYEGFGLPPLEAMACGAPVICSDASSLPEVVGDAALCVAAEDVDGWAAALTRLLDDSALRDDLRRRGALRAAQFSYRRTAAQSLRVIERAATGHETA